MFKIVASVLFAVCLGERILEFPFLQGLALIVPQLVLSIDTKKSEAILHVFLFKSLDLSMWTYNILKHIDYETLLGCVLVLIILCYFFPLGVAYASNL